MKKSSKIITTVLSLGIGATLLTGYSYNNTSKPKSLTESIQGHWKDQDGVNYYISDKKFIMEDTDGSIRKFNYLITVENNNKNDIEIELKTVEGQLGITHDIQFNDKNRKSAAVTNDLGVISIDLPKDKWSYVDNKTDME